MVRIMNDMAVIKGQRKGMVFSSLEFIFRFLPIFFLAYFVTPSKYRNIVIVAGSLVFYAVGEPVYVFLMMLSILINYALAVKISDCNGKKSSTVLLVLGIFIDIGILFFFKYMNFFVGNICAVAGIKAPEMQLTLPLGISFYTFQIMSYIIDVYKGKYSASRNFMDVATYISMFPQLIAGPIVSFDEISPQLKNRKVRFIDIEWGMMLFVVGLVYKVMLANRIGSLWNDVMVAGVMGIDAPTAWLGAWGYSMQIYFDFFGYSLMAIGMGRMLGFKFPENFANPYCAVSAADFWRRWHMTLGRWFRQYVYIPLGGNKKGKARMVLNTFIVWLLTGLWHGAAWNFIIWGLFFFVLIVLEKLFYQDFLKRHPVIGHIYMLIIIPVSWVIFNITNLHELWLYLLRMFGSTTIAKTSLGAWDKFLSLLLRYRWLLIICILCATPLPMRFIRKHHGNIFLKLALVALFWLCVYQLSVQKNNPFLYFRF